MSAGIISSFLLRGVDPETVRARYRSGGFATVLSKPSIKLSNDVSVMKESLSTNDEELFYLVTTRAHGGKSVATCSGYQDHLAMKNKRPCSLGPCEHCGKLTTEGYPIEYKESTVIRQDDEGIDRRKVLYYFWTEGRSCSFPCSLAIMRRRRYLPSDAISHLFLLYALMHPGAPPLMPAHDLVLHEKCGGPLSDEKWHENSLAFRRTGRVIVDRARVEYLSN